jgi:hypothetical protein
MILRCCLQCENHIVKEEAEEKMSYCSRENCWSEFSKCLMKTALKELIKKERISAQEAGI